MADIALQARFYRLAHGKTNPDEIVDIAKSVFGSLQDYEDAIIAFAEDSGLSITGALIEVKEQSSEAKKQREKEKQRIQAEENIAKTIETAQKYQENLNNGVLPTDERMKELATDIVRTASDIQSTINENKRQRFATYEGILEKLRKDEPEKDFTSRLVNNLRCPNGTLSIVSARPAGGKTSVLINLAREALDTGRSVFFVNLEMNELQIFRNLCLSFMYDMAKNEGKGKQLVGINQTIIQFNRSFKYQNENAPYPKNPVFADYQKQAMYKIGAMLKHNRLFIYDGLGNSLENITADILSKVKEHDIVLLDYMQRSPAPVSYTREQRYIQIQQASRMLLDTSIRSQIVIISGAQLGRDAGKEGEAKMSDLRESGDIENDAHNIIAIEKNKEDQSHYTHILKAREGGGEERVNLEVIRNYIYWSGIDEEAQKNDVPYDPDNLDEIRRKLGMTV